MLEWPYTDASIAMTNKLPTYTNRVVELSISASDKLLFVMQKETYQMERVKHLLPQNISLQFYLTIGNEYHTVIRGFNLLKILCK